MKQLEPNSVDLILTDPPYGTTACKWDAIVPLAEMWTCINWVRKENAAICLFGNQPFSSLLGASNLSELKYQWVWKKHHPTGHLNAKKMPMKIQEEILVFYKAQPVYNPQGTTAVNWGVQNSDSDCRRGGDNKTSTVSGGLRKDYIQTATNYPRNILEFNSCNGNKYHPTQKPVDLLEYLIKTYTLPSQTVLDFTMGSGSTGVACVNTGRNFIGIEKDEKYFEIAKKRIEEAQKVTA
jgi:site-specific DNA-methyltransferase (adenine-specific)